MTTAPTHNGMSDVPTQVFEKFLQALGDADTSVELIDRLRKTLLEDEKLTEGALKKALFAEDSLR